MNSAGIKKFITGFLICSQASGAFGSQLACHDLFFTSSDRVLDWLIIDQSGDSKALAKQMSAYDIIQYDRKAGVFTKLLKRFGAKGPAPVEFNLARFRSTTAFYEALLKDPARNAELKADTPRNFEEVLALIEASNKLNPVPSLIDAIPKWLATASAKDIESMTKLLEFKNEQSPNKTFTQLAKLLMLSRSPAESYREILDLNLDPKAERIIVRQANIAIFNQKWQSAMKELNIANPTGVKAFVSRMTDTYPNASTYAVNSALAAVEISQIGMPLFSTLHELNLVKSPMQKVTEAQRLQIVNGQLKDLPPELQKRLLRAAKTEIVWKRFLKIVAVAGLVYLIYFVKDRIGHDWFSTMPAAARADLETEVLGIYVSSLIVRGLPLPTEEELNKQREEVKSSSDTDLEKTVQTGGHLVLQAKKMLSDGSYVARKALAPSQDSNVPPSSSEADSVSEKSPSQATKTEAPSADSQASAPDVYDTDDN